MDLIITSRLVIPSRELKWRFSRSSGPGGQKVNKTNTRVEIIFNIEESKVLNDYQKKVLTKKLKNKLVNNCICLAVQEERNQLLNRQIAITALKDFNINKNIAFKELLIVNKKKGKITINDLGYLIGPVLNSGGRLGKSGFATELLSSNNLIVL